jgi:hypothetical protein
MIAVDEDVAIALVDGNGDGAELEMEYWFKEDGKWRAGQSGGHGPLDSLSISRWDAGPMVCAVGPAVPGNVFGSAQLLIDSAGLVSQAAVAAL